MVVVGPFESYGGLSDEVDCGFDGRRCRTCDGSSVGGAGTGGRRSAVTVLPVPEASATGLNLAAALFRSLLVKCNEELYPAEPDICDIDKARGPEKTDNSSELFDVNTDIRRRG